MLQVALLLLGSALSRYLWEINITIASVVLGVTSFGLLFYISLFVAGTVWRNCPYQTPGSRFFRYLVPAVRRRIPSPPPVLENILEWSLTTHLVQRVWNEGPSSPCVNIVYRLVLLPIGCFTGLVVDVCRLARHVIRTPVIAYRLARGVQNRLHHRVSLTPEQRLDRQQTVSGLRCISWTLRTSLDKPVHLLALEHLVTITEFPYFDPALAVDCFNILLGYISISDGNKVVVMRGLEKLATLSAKCFFQTLRHLSATHPGSSVLEELHRRYRQTFPFETDFRGLPFYHTITNIHALVHQYWNPRDQKWTDYLPSDQELIPFARHMVDAAQAEYRQTQNKRVPRWILRFALHFLSLNPPSPVPVIADCLTIIAIALDLDPSGVPVPDERYVCSVL